jgi:hypothetical protein
MKSKNDFYSTVKTLFQLYTFSQARYYFVHTILKEI